MSKNRWGTEHRFNGFAFAASSQKKDELRGVGSYGSWPQGIKFLFWLWACGTVAILTVAVLLIGPDDPAPPPGSSPVGYYDSG